MAVNNIMYDRRVVRGSSFNAADRPLADFGEVKKQREAERRRLVRANQSSKRLLASQEVLSHRKDMDIQTDQYLEEMTGRAIESEAQNQVDYALDRPPSPLFMPAKIGVDMETQIEDGELFNFDAEVEPILEVLIGKTLDQSMMEVLEKAELDALLAHQKEFQSKRSGLLVESQRMQAVQDRRDAEQHRRFAQAEAQSARNRCIVKKIVARAVASSKLCSIKDRVFAQLEDAGAFADAGKLTIDRDVMPGLVRDANRELSQVALDRRLVTDVFRSTMSARAAAQENRLECERRRLLAMDQAEREEREERAAEKLRQSEAAAQLQAGREDISSWESFVPDPPETMEVRLMSLNEDNMAAFGDDGIVNVAEDAVPELQALLGSLEEGQIVIGTITRPGGDVGWSLQSFRAGAESELLPAEAPPEEDASGPAENA